MGAGGVCWAGFSGVCAPPPGRKSHPGVWPTRVSLGFRRVTSVCKGLGPLGVSACGPGGRWGWLEWDRR